MANRRELSDEFIKSYSAPEKTTEIYDSKIENLAIRIYKTGTKSFVYRYYFNKTSKRFTIGKFPNISTEKARIKASQVYDKVQQGIDPIAERKKKKSQNQSITFKNAVSQFIDEYASLKSDSTHSLYKRVLNRQMKALHPVYLSELDRKKVMDIVRAKLRKGHPAMAEHMRKITHKLLNWCVQNGITESNVIKGVGEVAEKNRRERYYSIEEIIEIWELIETFKEPYRSFYKILFYTGQRKNETRFMKWVDIDSHKALWTIPATDTKSNREHNVPLTIPALKVLNELYKNHSKHSRFVFKSTRSNKPFKGIDYYSKKIKNNTSIKDFRNHDVRRTVATHMSKLGVIPFVIGRILNHKKLAEDDDITARYNQGDYLNEKKEALEKWNKYLSKIIAVDRIRKVESKIDDDSNKIAKFIIDSELLEHNFQEDYENNKPTYPELNLDF